MVALRVEEDRKFCYSKSNHSTLWNAITKTIREKGYSVTSVQCQNKWKSLKREYMSIMDHNNKTGNEPKTSTFFEDFNCLYGTNPKTKPKYTISSSSFPVDSDEEPVIDDDSSSNY